MHESIKNRIDKKRITGVGMVEVLVAVVVLGGGMLGIASLYVTTLKANTTALSRMQAIYLVNDIADRIRTNRTATTGYDTATATAANKNCADSTTAAVDCSVSDMAANDLWQWNQSIASALPGSPTGTVVVDNATLPVTYTITVNWTEPNSGTLNYSLKVQI